MGSFEKFELDTFGMSDEDILCDAIENKRYAKAYSMLRKRKEPLEERHAANCLSAALDCTPKLFQEVLEHCAPGEYSGSVTISAFRTGYCYHVSGTLLVLAAAMDRIEHMRLLLEYGYDVNAASLASAQADLHNHTFFHRSGGVAGNR